MMIALLASACSSNERTVSGQLATDQFELKGAQAVAIDEVGQTYRVPVAEDGRFALALPVGKTYSVRFANSTTKPGVYDAFAVLVNHDRAGDAHRHFKLTAGSTIDLGRVQQSNTRSLALTAADSDDDDADSSDDDDGDSSDDGDSDDSDSDSSSPSEADVDQICDLSGGDDMVSVSGTSSALEATDSDEDGVSDADDDSDSDSDGCDDSDSDDSDSDSDDGMTGTSSTSDDADSEDDSDSDSDSDSSGHSNDCDASDQPSDDECGTAPGEGAPDADVPPVEGMSPGTGGV